MVRKNFYKKCMNDSILNQVSPNQQMHKLLEASNKSLVLSTLFKTTYGVNGKTKMIIKNNQPIISNIPSQILKNLKTIHPLQILIREKLDSIEKYGDCSNFLIILFHFLLEKNQKLLLKGIKPSQLTAYLSEIKEEVMEILKENCLEINNTKLMIEGILKQEKLVELVLESYFSISENFEIKNGGDIQIYKTNGSLNDSFIEKGIVIQNMPEGFVKKLVKRDLKYNTLILSCPFGIQRTETKGTVLFEKAEEMLRFDIEEEKIIEKKVKSLKADLIICERVDDKFLDLANENNKMVLIVNSKFELLRLQKLFGGVISPSFRDFDDFEFGSVDSIEYQNNMTIARNDSLKIITIVLKSHISSILDEKARLIQKSLKILHKAALKKNSLKMVEGAGKIEKLLGSKIQTDYPTSKTEVAKAVKESFLDIFELVCDKNVEIYDDFESKFNAVRYAFELIEDVILCEDYFMSRE